MNQLALPLTLADHAVFESFHPAGNEPAVAYLEDMTHDARGPGCWLWGPAASGKSHLLQALAARFGDEAVYLPLLFLAEAGADILHDLAQRRCICVDDVDRVAGNESFELALFDLCNQLADHDGILVVAAASAPRETGIVLPDLESRLSRLPVFHIVPLDEAGRIAALQLRAEHRGLELPGDTARFLLTRHRRDMASLYGLLDRLDVESLKARRRLTIPFVRDFLD